MENSKINSDSFKINSNSFADFWKSAAVFDQPPGPVLQIALENLKTLAASIDGHTLSKLQCGTTGQITLPPASWSAWVGMETTEKSCSVEQLAELSTFLLFCNKLPASQEIAKLSQALDVENTKLSQALDVENIRKGDLDKVSTASLHKQLHRSFLGLGRIKVGQETHFTENWNTFIPSTNGIAPSSMYGLGRVVTGATKYMKGRSTDETVRAFEAMQSQFVTLLDRVENELVGLERLHRLVDIGRSLNQAISGEDGKSGLNGYADTVAGKMINRTLAGADSETPIAATTYIKEHLADSMKQRVSEDLLRAFGSLPKEQQQSFGELDLNNIFERLCHTEELPNTLPYCPEAEYTEKEWKWAMELSLQDPLSDPGYVAFYLKFRGGKALTELKVLQGKWKWYDEVPVSKAENAPVVVLSALPRKSDIDQLIQNGVGAIISVTEPFEVHAPEAANPEMWKEKGIDQLMFTATDFVSLPMNDLLRISAFINRCLAEGKKPLIHCKAGRGRSLAGLMSYMMQHADRMTPEAAQAHVKQYRAQAGLKETDAKWHSVKRLESLLNASNADH